jgi:glutamine synthetase
MRPVSPDETELQQFLDRYPATRAIEVLLPDINGILRGKRVNREQFDGLFGRGINVPATAQIMDSRGHVISGLGYGTDDGDPDYICRPVAGSLAPVPWLGAGLAQCMLGMYRAGGEPFFADSRYVLQKVCERLRAAGIEPVTAVELEFFLLADADAIVPVPRTGRIPGTTRYQQGPQMYNLEDLHELDGLFVDIEQACLAQGLPSSTAISEYAPGQFEINLQHVADPLLACDHAVLLRRLIRGVARRHGLAATFMAKPFAEHGGSGQHVHVSLRDAAGNNLLVDGTEPGKPGPALRHAVAGLVAHMAESMAVFCPNPNSFRRLRPGSFAPVSPKWGYNHRNLAVRIPLSGPADLRIEHRVPGADANPYLVMAAILAALHAGIEQKQEPPPMVAAGDTVDEAVQLPIHWYPALEALDNGRLLPGYLGAEFMRVYAAVRHFECEAFSARVSSLDYDWYLRSI